jgi:hypothetical protein
MKEICAICTYVSKPKAYPSKKVLLIDAVQHAVTNFPIARTPLDQVGNIYRFIICTHHIHNPGPCFPKCYQKFYIHQV